MTGVSFGTVGLKGFSEENNTVFGAENESITPCSGSSHDHVIAQSWTIPLSHVTRNKDVLTVQPCSVTLGLFFHRPTVTRRN